MDAVIAEQKRIFADIQANKKNKADEQFQMAVDEAVAVAVASGKADVDVAKIAADLQQLRVQPSAPQPMPVRPASPVPLNAPQPATLNAPVLQRQVSPVPLRPIVSLQPIAPQQRAETVSELRARINAMQKDINADFGLLMELVGKLSQLEQQTSAADVLAEGTKLTRSTLELYTRQYGEHVPKRDGSLWMYSDGTFSTNCTLYLEKPRDAVAQLNEGLHMMCFPIALFEAVNKAGLKIFVAWGIMSPMGILSRLYKSLGHVQPSGCMFEFETVEMVAVYFGLRIEVDVDCADGVRRHQLVNPDGTHRVALRLDDAKRHYPNSMDAYQL